MMTGCAATRCTCNTYYYVTCLVVQFVVVGRGCGLSFVAGLMLSVGTYVTLSRI